MDMTYFGDHGPSARLLGPWWWYSNW